MRRTLFALGLAGLVGGFLTTASAEDQDLFTKLDANQDGVVTADEIPEPQKRLFERLLRTSDENGDGKLGRAELKAGLKPKPEEKPAVGGAPGGFSRPQFDPEQIFQRLDRDGNGKIAQDEAPERMKQNFARVDTDGSGDVTKEEFVTAAKAMMQAGPPRQDNASPEARQKFAEAIFARLDANGDGKIALSEVPEERRENFTKALEKFDTDGDQAVTKEQFLKMFASGPPNVGAGRPGAGGPDVEMLIKRLKEADANGDEMISREEAPPRMKENFDRIDANGDGQIDKAEVRKMLERFRQMQANKS